MGTDSEPHALPPGFHKLRSDWRLIRSSTAAASQENMRGKQAVILQEEVIKRILSKYLDEPTITRETIYENDWLDVEDLFRDAGWQVVYDKPSGHDSYPTTFTFIKP